MAGGFYFQLSVKFKATSETCILNVHLWTWLSWHGQRKRPNEHPLEHCVKQQAVIGRFPSFPQQHAVPVLVPLQIPHFQVWGSNPSQGNSTFPGLGFESQSRQFHVSRSGVRIPVKAIFSLFSFSQLSATVNQWRIFFRKLYQLVNMSDHWSHIRKNCQVWDSNSRPGNVEFDVELGLLLHTVFQWVFIRKSALWWPLASHSVPMGLH